MKNLNYSKQFMNILLLGGNSVQNKSWVEDIAKVIPDLFDEVAVQDYYHWRSGEDYIDLDKEIDQLVSITKDWSEYIAFAKSIGTILALRAISEGKISPKKLIFFGFPYIHSKEKGYEVDKYLEQLNIPAFFIQKSEDGAIHYDDLEKLIKEKVSDKYKLLKYHRNGEPDNEHHYADIEYIRSLLKEWIDED